MKNKALSGLMLSLIVLSTAAPIATAKADTTDDQIAQQNSIIDAASSNASSAKAAADNLQKQVDDANARLTELQAESTKLSAQIVTLVQNIADRDASLKSQARSAQTNGGATSYINTLLNAKSLTDVVQKITAMSQVASNSSDMLKKQQDDQKAIQQKLADNKKSYAEATSLQQQLAVQEQQLQAAQLSYQATIATAQDQKDSLLAQKAAAEAKAAEVAAAQAAAVTASQTTNSTNTNTSTSTSSSVSDIQVAQNTGSSSTSTGGSYTSVGTSSSNPYPAGQCTAYVWQYFGGRIPTYSGNAGDWVAYANSSVGAGRIAVFPAGVDGAGGYGHVAVVTSVNGDGSFEIIEGNFNGGWGTTRHIASTAGVYFIQP
ncbi:MAG: CHAP domain-containing protein [Streptococcaceae bacterium]|nr:CHAP domain-containing protein [Streptococcaceae bacterium]